MVVDYKHKIGFEGTILIEPKPQEPTKHQYDYDVATVFGFLQRFGLEKEVKVNIEVGHAYPRRPLVRARDRDRDGARHLRHRSTPTATTYQSGWDTDQFPNNVPETALALYYILKAGGLDHRRLQLRLQAAPPVARPGGPDRRACRRHGRLRPRPARRGGDDRGRRPRGGARRSATPAGRAPEAQAMLTSDLETIAARVDKDGLDPQPRSGRQERLENWVNRFV